MEKYYFNCQVCMVANCSDLKYFISGTSLVKTLSFQCRGHRFDPWSGKEDAAYCAMWLKIKWNILSHLITCLSFSKYNHHTNTEHLWTRNLVAITVSASGVSNLLKNFQFPLMWLTAQWFKVMEQAEIATNSKEVFGFVF